MTKKTQPDTVMCDVITSETKQPSSNIIVLPKKFPTPLVQATYHVTERASSYGLQPLQDNELRSIYTLFAWVSNEQKAAKETIQSMTEAHFGIDNVTNLKKRDYDEVIRFLVNLRIDEMKH